MVDARQGRLDDPEGDELASSRPPDATREVREADETGPARMEIPWETRTPLEAYADLRQQTDSGWEPGRRFDAPREELEKFDPERAALPPASPEEADRHVAEHRGERPWLTVTDNASPEAKRIIAAADAGDGHGHIRHEGWVTEAANLRRAAYLEDPAQLDPEKRSNGVDGIKPGDKRHVCASVATRITDPDAYATAFARGVNHPDVRAALDAPFDPIDPPDPVLIPIDSLLGSDGHKFCTGWRLDPIDGSDDVARDNRKEWVAARSQGREADVPAPAVAPVPTFEGGHIVFVITRDRTGAGHEIKSMYPDPPEGN